MRGSKRILSVLLVLSISFSWIIAGGNESLAKMLGMRISAYDISFEHTAYWPVPSSTKMSRGFYYTNDNNDKNDHQGIDIKGSSGAVIIASKSGKVVDAKPTACNHDGNNGENHNCSGTSMGTYGNYVEIKNDDGTTSRYGHMQYNSICVSINQHVSAGDKIGLMGSTGASTGTHLHFEIYKGNNKSRWDQNINPSKATIDRLGITGNYIIGGREYYRYPSGSSSPTNDWQPTPEIHDDKNIVTINESITFSYAGLSNCSRAEFCFLRSGESEPYYSVDSTLSRELTTYFENPGTYEIYARGYYNGSWYNSSKIRVSVLDAKLVADKSSVKTGEIINFEYSGLTYASKVEIVFCDKDENPYWTEDITSSRTYSNYYENEGLYKVYARYLYDGNWGKTNTVTIFALNPKITTSKTNVGVSEEFDLSYSGLTMANAVYYYIFNGAGEFYSAIDSTQNRTLTIHFTEADCYQICAVGYTNDRSFESNYLSVSVHENSFQISYDANGGNNPPASQEKKYSVPLTLSSVVPERIGYVFLGWSESSSATTATYTAGSSFTKDANTTLYAVWKLLPRGDANGDNTIDLKDVVQITRYLAGGWDVTVDLTAADVNKDGEVNLKDAVLLRRYLAGGWDIQLA